jgi:hypothetical protein
MAFVRCNALSSRSDVIRGLPDLCKSFTLLVCVCMCIDFVSMIFCTCVCIRIDFVSMIFCICVCMRIDFVANASLTYIASDKFYLYTD